MAKYAIINARYGGADMDEIWEDNRYIATVPDGKGQETVKLIEGETAPLHAEIEMLKVENARLLAELANATGLAEEIYLLLSRIAKKTKESK